MKFLSLAALALFAAAPVLAAPTTIDFETAPDWAPIAEHYASVGVSFGGGADGMQNSIPEFPSFSNAPSPLGIMVGNTAPALMNVADGFSGVFSFWYSSFDAVAGGVSIWSGLDGTGDLLASFDLLGNAQDGCDDSPFCRFDLLSTTLHSAAYSVTFAEAIGFDNVTFNEVPEPASALLMGLGLAGLAAARRRRT
ncbi:PEP-CTERM sorting domain-containing protein [Pseudorhodoferax sp.]|uniref:PEP-CTERM sorting domain-containing protein n=1 Tax=Pseudorhodoferax sp. TaxID=1993553 RepID=UPI002DD62233|nr:PEP-CTERM sorting domain-containing protein [Pseudorhodoferax sp.]